MRIKEFNITRYGPLSNQSYQLENFTLFFGENESGKTLMVDALIKLLLGRGAKKEFKKALNRVEEDPVGSVIIEYGKEEYILPTRDGTLVDITGLNADECRNIFIVRNSDLLISNEFYDNLTDRLMGLKLEKIHKIEQKVRERGELMKRKRELKRKLKAKCERIDEICKKIEKLKRTRAGEIDELELRFFEYKKTLEEIRRRIHELENARRREKYEEGTKILAYLEDIINELRELQVYNDDDERAWYDSEKTIKECEESCEKLKNELKLKKEQLTKIGEEIEKREGELRLSDMKIKQIEAIQPELMECEERITNLRAKARIDKTLVFSQIILLIITFCMCLYSLLVTNFLPLLISTMLSTTVLVLIAIVELWFLYNRWKLGKKFERVKLRLSRLGIHGNAIENILYQIEECKNKHYVLVNELNDKNNQKSMIEGEIRTLERNLSDSLCRLEEAEKCIERIKNKSGVSSLAEYREKLRRKKNLEEQMREKEIELKRLFGARGKTLDEKMSYWREQVKKLTKYKDIAKDVKYDEEEMQRLMDERERYEQEIEDLNRRLSSIRDEIKDIEREANSIMQGKVFRCETLADLDFIKEKLTSIKEAYIRREKAAKKLIELCEDIEREERQKIHDLLSKGSSASMYFNRITNGAYDEVVFRGGEIVVKRRDGIELTVEKLSGGAYDQLYFAIRLALGEKLLKDKKGFFILDDPFIRADEKRLLRQLEMLKRLSASGWQIIYFSAKKEVKEALKDDIEKGLIKCISLPPLIETITKSKVPLNAEEERGG